MNASDVSPADILRVGAAQIVGVHEEATVSWHGERELPYQQNALLTMVVAQHRENFDLWHQEDKARDLAVADAEIVQAKHAIDVINQRRNDLVEQIDRYLLEHLRMDENASLHSETPGLMIDRLSILALKIFHTVEQTLREEVSDAHRAKNQGRLTLLQSQRDDLAGCLDVLWAEIASGHKRFKVYQQLKMYNDPELNPVLYGRRR